MDIQSILEALDASGLSKAIRDSLFLFPMLEAVHVMGLALVFGTILAVDLRLLGLAWSDRPVSKVAGEGLKWTWAAFALAVLTGALMFTTNAEVYFHNTPFRLKMLMMALAGLNMVVFHFVTQRSMDRWDQGVAPPAGAKIAAVLSLALWVGVIGAGRWIGFTVTRAADVAPPPADVNFDDFLGGADPAAAPPSVDVNTAAPAEAPGG